MATTFCMTGSRSKPPRRLFVGQIVSQREFQDVCAKSGKWFLEPGELFRRGARDETIERKMAAV
jgi:hypothetical protein